jgi:hypothetical protein
MTAGDKVQSFTSQHPFAESSIGSPSVCSYHEENIHEALACVKLSLNSELSPIVPAAFTEEEYLKRVKEIFVLS